MKKSCLLMICATLASGACSTNKYASNINTGDDDYGSADTYKGKMEMAGRVYTLQPKKAAKNNYDGRVYQMAYNNNTEHSVYYYAGNDNMPMNSHVESTTSNVSAEEEHDRLNVNYWY